MPTRRKNKKNNKIAAVIISLAVLIPTVVILFVVFNLHPGKLEPDGINAIKVTSAEGKEFTYTDIETFTLYADIFESALVIADPLHDENEYKVFKLDIDCKSDDISCDILLSNSQEDCLLRMVENNQTVFKIILPEYAGNLLMDEIFATAYTYYLPPKAHITLMENTYDAVPSEMSWYLRKCDGEFYSTDTASFISNDIPLYDYTPSATVDMGFELVPDVVSVQIFDKDAPIFSGKYGSEEYKSFTHNKKSTLEYVFTAEWFESSTSPYHGKAVYRINLNYMVTPVGLVSSSKITQGDLLVFSIYNTADDEVLTVENENLQLYRMGDAQLLFYPAYIGGFVGQKDLTVIDSDNNRISSFIEVVLPEEDSENYTLHETLPAELYTADYQNPDTALSSILASTSQSGEKMWEGKFSSPIYAPDVLLNYGQHVVKEKTYQDGQTTKESIGQSAYMLLKSASADVKAIGTGKVAFVGTIEPLGKTIIIDHGLGIFSLYSNLDSFYISQGDSVTKELTIAKLNVISGAALQFGVMVNGYFINPEILNSCLEAASLV